MFFLGLLLMSSPRENDVILAQEDWCQPFIVKTKWRTVLAVGRRTRENATFSCLDLIKTRFIVRSYLSYEALMKCDGVYLCFSVDSWEFRLILARS